MTTAKSKRLSREDKPKKSGPLFLHQNGQYAKKVKIGGIWRLLYFGTDPEESLDDYLEKKQWLDAGKHPPKKATDVANSLKNVCDLFLDSKKKLLRVGKIKQRTLDEYEETASDIKSQFGPNRDVFSLEPSDFDDLFVYFSEKFGVYRRGNSIQRTRSIFNHLYESGFIDKPIRFGQNFKKPSPSELRAHRHASPDRIFDPADLKSIIKASSPNLKAMILLGINAGFNNSECAQLRVDELDLKAKSYQGLRPKTKVVRSCVLFKETVDALKEVISKDDELVFRTRFGNRYRSENINNEFQKIAKKLKVYRPGLSFGSLRHTFQTIAESGEDSLAITIAMGHADNSISARYRGNFPISRLKKVSDTIRKWLYPKKRKSAK